MIKEESIIGKISTIILIVNQYVLIAIIVGVFAVGIITGAFGSHLSHVNYMEKMMSGGMSGMSGMGSMSGGMQSRHGQFYSPGIVHQLCHQDSTMSPAYCEPYYQVVSSIPGVKITHIHPVDNTTLEVTLTEVNSAKNGIDQDATIFVGNDFLSGNADILGGWSGKTTVNVNLQGMGIIYDYESMHAHLTEKNT